MQCTAAGLYQLIRTHALKNETIIDDNDDQFREV